MDIKKFADMVLEALGRNDQDFPVDRRDVMVMTDVVVSGILGQMVDARQPIPDGFYTNVLYPVTTDAITGMKVVELKSPGVVTLSNNAGIKSFGSPQDPTKQYLFLQDGQLATISNLEVAGLNGQSAGWVTGTKLYLYQINHTIDKVMVKCIPNISEQDEEEEFFASDQIFTMIFDAVVARLGYKAQKPEDKVNDNRS